MKDLISRQNLREQLNEICDKQCPYNEPTKAIGACCASCSIDDVIEIVQNLPSAEKTGKWIHDGCDHPHGVDWMHCSECGKRDVFCPNTMTNFCPNCGAKMEVQG